MAQDQGLFAEAEQRFKLALELAIGLNDRGGTTRTLRQLGILLTQAGRPAEATPFSALALVARREVAGASLEIDLQWIKRQRRLIADEVTFARIITTKTSERVYGENRSGLARPRRRPATARRAAVSVTSEPCGPFAGTYNARKPRRRSSAGAGARRSRSLISERASARRPCERLVSRPLQFSGATPSQTSRFRHSR